jgi:hypothetical protein
MGRDVRLPVAVRDATAAIAYYLVSAKAAQRLIAPSGLRVADVLPGRTLCTIGTMDYREGDLGRYHELGMTFFVQDRAGPRLPFVDTALGLLRGGLGAYIQWLPVDGEFTCEAGRSIWGFPKFIAEITISTSAGVQTSVLKADGAEVLRQAVPAGDGRRAFHNRQQVSYAYREGVLYKTPSIMNAEAVDARLRGARLELGTHPIAAELRALGLPKRPLFSTYIGKMTATFFAAERLPIQPS